MKKYRDHYFLKAKQENYPARSVYKLQEMNKKFKLFKPGQKVLDLGAAPGSWTLFAAKQVGPAGRIVGVDLQATDTVFPDNVSFYQDDVFEPSEALRQILEELKPFDLVISDMAPKTTGIKITDQSRSLELAEEALALAKLYLIKGGHFVVKIFLGPDVKPFLDAMRPGFESVKTFKPQSSRAESKEQFILGLSAL